jgi:heme A synthase
MATDKSSAAVGLGEPGSGGRDSLTPWRPLLAGSLLAGVFAQAVLAGLILSGVAWARTAHSALAFVLVAASLAAGLVALFNRHRTRGGRRLGVTLLSLSAALVLQAAIGALSAKKGVNLLWLHIPLGVALVGFAVQATVAAGRPRSE